MRLSDEARLAVNPSPTLPDIPAKVFDYRLGNRSALEWVIDQYQVQDRTGSPRGVRTNLGAGRTPDALSVAALVTVAAAFA